MLGFYLNSGDCGGDSVEASFDCSDVEDTPECIKQRSHVLSMILIVSANFHYLLLFFTSKDKLLAPKLTGKKII